MSATLNYCAHPYECHECETRLERTNRIAQRLLDECQKHHATEERLKSSEAMLERVLAYALQLNREMEMRDELQNADANQLALPFVVQA